MYSLRHSAFWILLLGTSFGIAEARDYMPWVADLVTAQQLAASRDQLILLHFSSEDCPPCRRLEKKVFSRRTFGHAIGELMVPVHVNVTKSPELAKQFNVSVWPTDLVLTANGQEIHRMVSPQDQTQYLTTLRQVAWRHRTTSPGAMVAQYPVKTPVTTTPLHTNTAFTSPQTPGAPANTGLPPREQTAYARGQMFRQQSAATSAQPASFAAPPMSQAAPVAPPVTAPPTTPQASSVQNQYVANSGSMPATQPTESSVYGGSIYGSPAQGNVSTPAMSASPPTAQNGTPMTPPVQNHQTSNPLTHSGPSVTSGNTVDRRGSVDGSQVQPAVNHATYAANGQVVRTSAHTAMPQAAPAEPRMGLEGYCPVTLSEGDQWVKGDVKWGARHRGRVYLFQTAAAQQRFLSDPDRYSPILSGFDPVVFVETGQLVEGFRAHGLRFKDSIVLFSSEQSLERFAQNPAGVMARIAQPVQTASAVGTPR